MSRWQAAGTAAHWAACTAVAFLAAEAAPFDGLYATVASLVIAAGVGLIGLALTPQERRR